MTAEELDSWGRQLGLPGEALTKIASEEGASSEGIEEALNRLENHPAWKAGEIRSPLAFFRGIIRGVQRDRAVAMTTERRPPPPKKAFNPPRLDTADIALGKGRLLALRLFVRGRAQVEVLAVLRESLPELHSDQQRECLKWAIEALPGKAKARGAT